MKRHILFCFCLLGACVVLGAASGCTPRSHESAGSVETTSSGPGLTPFNEAGVTGGRGATAPQVAAARPSYAYGATTAVQAYPKVSEAAFMSASEAKRYQNVTQRAVTAEDPAWRYYMQRGQAFPQCPDGYRPAVYQASTVKKASPKKPAARKRTVRRSTAKRSAKVQQVANDLFPEAVCPPGCVPISSLEQGGVSPRRSTVKTSAVPPQPRVLPAPVSAAVGPAPAPAPVVSTSGAITSPHSPTQTVSTPPQPTLLDSAFVPSASLPVSAPQPVPGASVDVTGKPLEIKSVDVLEEAKGEKKEASGGH